MDFNKIIGSIVDDKVKRIIAGDKLESGHNGPYYDPETHVRVNAHWILVFAAFADRKSEYKSAIHILADDLYNCQNKNGTFECRNKEGKDKINGVIGAAWAIEGLVGAARVLHDAKYYEAACRAFRAFLYDESAGLWKRVDVTGEELGYDITYNHQLWFAASGAVICSYKIQKDIEKNILDFLYKSRKTMWVFRNGLIYHYAFCNRHFRMKVSFLINNLFECARMALNKPSLKYKEEGYHNFCMFAFAILHRYYPEHFFFNTKKFRRALKYSLNFHNEIKLITNSPKLDITRLASKYHSECNIYSYSYNSPAYEMPLIIEEFAKGYYEKELQMLLDYHVNLTYDKDQNSFCRNTEDAITLDSRIYEFLRPFTL